jgi:tRNA-binding EMAP/Myf-like protein
MIDIDHFDAVDMRVGRVVAVDEFPEARIAAWKLTIDFGPEVGTKRSSARITHYTARAVAGHARRRGRQLPAAAHWAVLVRGSRARRAR